MSFFELVALISSIATTVGVFIAAYQIYKTTELHRTQFEDSLAMEYRELIQKIPIKVFIGEDLTHEELEITRPVLFHYLNLTNDQIFLRSKDRVGPEVWKDWRNGIEHNITNIRAINEFWAELKANSIVFEELRRLEEVGFSGDPHGWSVAGSPFASVMGYEGSTEASEES